MKLMILDQISAGYPQIDQIMETVLSMWRIDNLNPHSTAQGNYRFEARLKTGELSAWHSLLIHSSVFPPSSHLDGLKKSIQVNNQINPDKKISEEELLRDGTIHRIGNRIATRYLRAQGAFKLYEWTLCINSKNSDPMHSDIMNACKENRFETIHIADTEIVLTNPRREMSVEDGIFLAILTQYQTDAEEIFLLWQKSMALGVSKIFLQFISQSTKVILAKKLHQILLENRDVLDWRTDFILDNFSNGATLEQINTFLADAIFLKRKPSSRFDTLIMAADNLRSSHQEIVAQYYEAVIKALVLILGSGVALAEVFNELPPGRCLFAGLSTVVSHRPEFISWMVRCSTGAEGAYCVCSLEPRKYDRGTLLFQLQEEWQEVQRWMRSSLIMSDKSDMISVAISLAIYDENRQPNVPHEFKIDPWRKRFKDLIRAEVVIAQFCDLLNQVRYISTEEIIFALRLLQVAFELQPALSSRFATCIVRAYSQGMNLESSETHQIYYLETYPDLLQGLVLVLHQQPDVWEAWKNPFSDIVALLKRSATSRSSQSVQSEPRPGYAVPRLIFAHVHNLVIQALQAARSAALDLLNSIVMLYQLDYEHDNGYAFTWPTLTSRHLRSSENEDDHPLVGLGRCLARFPDAYSEYISKILVCDPSLLELAHLLWGLKDSPLSMRQPILDSFLPQFKEFIQKGEGALGYFSDLATALYGAEMYQESSECARGILQIVEKFSDHALYEYSSRAHLLLAIAAFRVSDFEQLFAIPLDKLQEHARLQLHNLRGAAFIQLGNYVQGKEELQTVLKSDQANEMALSNMIGSYSIQKDWNSVLAWASLARSKLTNPIPNFIIQHEIVAKLNLGLFADAARLLEELPGEVGKELKDQLLQAIAVSSGKPAQSAV